MKNEINETTFEFRGLYFNGLKLRSKLHSEEFYNKLEDEGSADSKLDYIAAVKEDQDEQIHVKLSFSLIFAMISVLTIIIAAFLTFNQILIPALVALAIGFGSQLLKKHFKTRANELYAGKTVAVQLVEVLFNK